VIEDFSDTLPDRAMRSHIRIADYYVERGQPDRASPWFQRGVEFWNSVPAERRAAFTAEGRDSAARAHFEIGEQIYQEFDAIQLRGDEAEVQAAFLSKTEAAQRAADRAVQISGGLGVTRGQKAEELYREVRALRVYEGASEIQRVVIARAERDRFLAEQQGGT
jgi:alkylation response protein AidB-like acyl-CoA dehydrogenase